MSDEALIQQLRENNDQFRMLFEEHVQLEEKLQEFLDQQYLQPDQEIEMKRLQKLKLLGKDKMEQILSQHRQ